VKVANLAGRAALISPDRRALDIAAASGGRFSDDPQRLFDDWSAFLDWAATADMTSATSYNDRDLGAPVPRPRQIFAIGINYTEHAAEAGYPPSSMPVTFTKFPTCLTGPFVEVTLPTATVDWEVELVAVIARDARAVSRDDAWSYVAGLMVGQDLSERTSQLAGAKPQFSLAKSFRDFGPTGPWLVTPDVLTDKNDLAISCALSGQVMQESRTSLLVYDIPELITRLSGVCSLNPGDLIFTGTPAGVGNARTPRRFLRPGDELVSSIEGLGEMRQTFR
jgi:2-keto-4-pentenoate hydratase/2-oxohepta-3-ene-1,7-dioic acid hydratase in catechol pathway